MSVWTFLLPLLVCLLLFVTKDGGGLICSFHFHLRRNRPLLATARKFSPPDVDSSSDFPGKDILHSKDGKIGAGTRSRNGNIANGDIMVSSSTPPSSISSTTSTPTSTTVSSSASSSHSSSQSKSIEDINFSYDKEDIHKCIYPLITSGNDLSANAGSALVNVLQGVQNEEGTKMTYDVHEGGGLFVNYHFAQASAQHDIRIGKFPSSSKLMCTSRIKRWWMVSTPT